MQQIFAETNLTVLAVSETWFNPSINSNLVNIPGYKLIRNDRKRPNSKGGTKSGGGVALYLKSGINYKIVATNFHNAITEFLFIEIDNGLGLKFAVGVVYNPPKNLSLDPLSKTLSNICSTFEHVIVLGDFNINLLVDSSDRKKLFNILTPCGLSCPGIEPTNFVPNCTPSQIDLLLIKNINFSKKFSQLFFAPTVSHDIILGSYSILMDKAEVDVDRKIRNIKKIVSKEVQAAASLQYWDLIYSLPSIDDQVELLTKNIYELLEHFAPLRPMRHKINPGVPWFTAELLNLINRRNFFHLAARGERNELQKRFYEDEYRTLRNKVTCLKRKLMRNYHKKHFNLEMPLKKLWTNLRTFGVVNEKCKPADKFSPSQFNTYFTSVFKKSSSDDLDQHADITSNSNSTNFNFRSVSSNEIKNALNSITSDALGEDQIPISFVKKLCPFILPFVTYIVNNCITASYFPKLWKIANVTPIPKVPNPPSVADFRPISILPSLSKVPEIILKEQLQDYIINHNLLYTFQSGFRPKHSTTTALLKIVDDFTKALARDEAIVTVFLDFKSAFDIVDHSVLLKKLREQFHLSPTSCSLVKSYLSNRWQRSRIGNETSDITPVTSGTPQGGILSALLFCLFINDFPDSLNLNVHLYADDATLYLSVPKDRINEGAIKMNDALCKVHSWAIENKALINPKKSLAMVISRKGNIGSPPLFIGGDPIEFTNCFKLLGLTITPNLCWDAHIKRYSGIIFGIISTLFKSQQLVPQSTRLYLVKSLVLPLWMYCSNITLGMSRGTWETLNRTFNLSIRYVFDLASRDHLTGFRDKILGCELEPFLKFRACVFMFNLIRTKQPNYLGQLIELNRLPRLNKLKVPEIIESKQRYESFFVQGVHLWNSLDTSLREINRADLFKKECLQFFVTKK